jgi:hypothetical protein
MTDKRCEQTKCSFFLMGHCQSCQICKAEPYIINLSCQKCLSCEQEEGELRFNAPSGKQEYEITISIRPKTTEPTITEKKKEPEVKKEQKKKEKAIVR